MEKIRNILKSIKAFFAAVWYPFGATFTAIFKALKWLDEHLPMWVIYNIMWGAIAGGSIYAVLGHYIGHGTQLTATGWVGASPFAAWAIPAGLFFGIGIAAWLFFWDVWAIRKYGQR